MHAARSCHTVNYKSFGACYTGRTHLSISPTSEYSSFRHRMASSSVAMEAQAAQAKLLEWYDPLLHLGSKPLDLAQKHEKAMKLHKGSGWSAPAQMASLTQLRAAVGYWLGSSNKAVVGQDDLDRLSALTSMMLSFSEQVVQLQHFSADWTSPLAVNQAPGNGLVGALVGVATAAATTMGSATVAAASSALSGAKAGEVLRSGWVAAMESNQARSAAAAAADQAGISPAALRTLWQATTLQQEAAMWVFAYAAAARQAGLQRYLGYARKSSLTATPSTDSLTGAENPAPAPASTAASDPVKESAAALQLLRQAAGLFEYLQAQVVPLVDLATEQQGNRRGPVPELQRPVLACLSLTCLAEAQAIAVARARDKGTSPGLLGSLEAGTSQVYLMARMALCGTPVPAITPSMGSLDAHYTPPASAAPLLNSVKRLHAYIVAAQEAEVVARNGVRTVRSIPGAEAAWAASLEAQRTAAVDLYTRCEKDRLQITYQPLPSTPLEPPSVKVLVSVIPTSPAPYTPPELPPQQEAQGQPCSIQ